MRITVEHNATKIIVDESDNSDQKDRKVSMRWESQNKAIQETIVVMAEQVVKLINSANDPN